MMEWDNKQQNQEQQQQQQQSGNGGGMVYVKVMTDEQLETLRKQIAAYATICEQLVEMHKNLTAQQDLAGARMGNLYCDPFIASSGHKITARQRWTPTPVQLQILERIFNQGTGTPDKQKIKEITAELSQHGQISESNVYNWFQNRRARSKRKQMVATSNNAADSEVETEVDSPKDKKTKPEYLISHQNSARRADDMCFQSHEMNPEMQFLNQHSNQADSTFPTEDGLKPSRSLHQTSIYDAMLSNSRADHLMGKMETTGSYGFYDQPEDYGMAG